MSKTQTDSSLASAPDTPGWVHALRQRRASLEVRAGICAGAALVASPVVSVSLSLTWALVNLAVIALETLAFAPVTSGGQNTMGPVRKAAGSVLMFVNAAVFCSIVIPLWAVGGADGGIGAIILLAAAATFSVVNSAGSHRVLFCTLTPPVAFMAMTPVWMAHTGAGAGLVTLAGASVICFIAYGVSVWSRMSRAHQAEIEARVEALRRQREAEAVMAGRNAFLAAIGHDLRTPIGAIMSGAIELERTAIDNGQRLQAELIGDASLMMKALLDDLLDHSKIEAGRMTVEVQDFDLRTLLARTWTLWRGAAAEKGLRFRIEGARHVPRWVRGDPVRLRQVLNNLLSNALKFTHEGSISLRLRAWPDDLESVSLLIDVADTGPGMRPDQMKRLFDPFDQTQDGVSARHGGTGLGMTISRDLVQLMGGRLTAWSQPGQGATFTVALNLPIGSADAAAIELADDTGRSAVARALGSGAVEPKAAPALQPAPTTAVSEVQPFIADAPADPHLQEEDPQQEDRPLRVLVVDDHDINRRAVELILAPVDCVVTSAADGMAALGLCAAEAFDVIFMDVRMPELDGRETTRRIRAGGGPNATVPVIAVTADTSPEDIEACMAAGMTYFVPKPLTPPALLGALQHVLNGGTEEEAVETEAA